MSVGQDSIAVMTRELAATTLMEATSVDAPRATGGMINSVKVLTWKEIRTLNKFKSSPPPPSQYVFSVYLDFVYDK